ncbi:hypothetical protein B0H63DRAFT_3078 [Podospora didyma]|uniref:Uncharacterized protein n=1 Tax=Podospora didyma TaxID=330526 RepID=A0AAE0P3Y4_9PEZI|nr:hypothetical protein B0H63DRAFT_3078 [Podospora didyma]
MLRTLLITAKPRYCFSRLIFNRRYLSLSTASMTSTAGIDETLSEFFAQYSLNDSSDEVTLSAIVQVLADQVQQASKVEDYVWDANHRILKLAGETNPGPQDALIEFLVKLRQTPVTKAGSDEPLVCEGGRVWTDLPMFGWAARDLWNFDIYNKDTKLEELNTFRCQNAFLAQLTALSNLDDPKDPFDYSLYALWTLRTALEDTPPKDASAGRVTGAVKLAEIWIHYAGDALKKLSAKNLSFEGNMGNPGDKYADRDWKGFSEERWAVWMEELKKAKKDDDDAAKKDDDDAAKKDDDDAAKKDDDDAAKKDDDDATK